MWEFPKIRGTILGVPIIRTIVVWGLYWGPPILGNYHMYFRRMEDRPYFWKRPLNPKPLTLNDELCWMGI